MSLYARQNLFDSRRSIEQSRVCGAPNSCLIRQDVQRTNQTFQTHCLCARQRPRVLVCARMDLRECSWGCSWSWVLLRARTNPHLTRVLTCYRTWGLRDCAVTSCLCVRARAAVLLRTFARVNAVAVAAHAYFRGSEWTMDCGVRASVSNQSRRGRCAASARVSSCGATLVLELHVRAREPLLCVDFAIASRHLGHNPEFTCP